MQNTNKRNVDNDDARDMQMYVMLLDKKIKIINKSGFAYGAPTDTHRTQTHINLNQQTQRLL